MLDIVLFYNVMVLGLSRMTEALLDNSNDSKTNAYTSYVIASIIMIIIPSVIVVTKLSRPAVYSGVCVYIYIYMSIHIS